MFHANTKTILGTAAMLALGAAAASAGEGDVRQASQNTQIRYQVGSPLNWSMTGFPNDSVMIVRGNGTVVAAGSLYNLAGSWPCYEWVQHSDGRITLRCQISNPSTDLNGGYARITGRNGAILDQDPFVRQ